MGHSLSSRSYLKNSLAARFPSSPPFSQGEKGDNPLSFWERDSARGSLEIASSIFWQGWRFLTAVDRDSQVVGRHALLGVLGASIPSPGLAATALGFDDARHLLNRTRFAAGPTAVRMTLYLTTSWPATAASL